MTDTATDFNGWLHAKLRELNTDETVFGDYIRGILEDEDAADSDSGAAEQRDALHEILSQIVEDEAQIEAVLSAILARWTEHGAQHSPGAGSQASVAVAKLDIDAQLAKLLDNSKAICTNSAKKRQPLSAEEMRIRDQILAQYSQVELEECEDDDDGGPPPASAGSASQIASAGSAGAVDGVTNHDPLMEKNTNKEDVAALAKERREQARTDSKAKKDKDKEDRYVT